jgi:hypothetical protein
MPLSVERVPAAVHSSRETRGALICMHKRLGVGLCTAVEDVRWSSALSTAHKTPRQ